MMVRPFVLLRFNPGIDAETAEAIIAESRAGAIVDRDWAHMKGAYRLRSESRNGFDVLDAANRLATRPEVRWAEPDMIFTVRPALMPDDPLFDEQWALHNDQDLDMNAPDAWDVTTGDSSVVVVIIDDGVDPSHPDINQIAGTDVTGAMPTGNGAPINACDRHGTAVASAVSAKINNAIGMAGMAPDTRIASARAYASAVENPCDESHANRQGCFSCTVMALDWAESIGARITNNSNGIDPSAALADKYEETRRGGMIHFAATGNDGVNTIDFPSILPSVHAIGSAARLKDATANDVLARWSTSQRGPGMGFIAPGTSITLADRSGNAGYESGNYTNKSGTSFASPLAAGVAALMLSADPALNRPAVERLLRESVNDLPRLCNGQTKLPPNCGFGYDETNGWGFIDAGAAVTLAGGTAAGCELAELLASNASSSNRMGYDVDTDGLRVIAGSLGSTSGYAYVFARDDNGTPANLGDDAWVEEALLKPLFYPSGDGFGFSVALDGDVAVVGAPFDDTITPTSLGAVHTFRRYEDSYPCVTGTDCQAVGLTTCNVDSCDGVAWVEEDKDYSPTSPVIDFGASVALHGGRLVVGAAGAAFTFHLDDGGTPSDPSDDTWSYENELVPTPGSAGASPYGGAVDVQGARAIVANAHSNETSGTSAGSAYVFRRYDGTYPCSSAADCTAVGLTTCNVDVCDGLTWVQEQKLVASDGAMDDLFGDSVALDDGAIAIGAPFDDCPAGSNCGSTYVFHLVDGSWVEQPKLVAPDAAAGDQFGGSVDITTDRLIAGAQWWDMSVTEWDVGAAYVYLLEGPVWIFDERLGASDFGTDDRFGFSVALDGALGVAGAYFDDEGVANTGSVYLFAAADTDRDCVPDNWDLCPEDHNPVYADPDSDGVPSACDNCPADANANQADTDTGSNRIEWVGPYWSYAKSTNGIKCQSPNQLWCHVITNGWAVLRAKSNSTSPDTKDSVIETTVGLPSEDLSLGVLINFFTMDGIDGDGHAYLEIEVTDPVFPQRVLSYRLSCDSDTDSIGGDINYETCPSGPFPPDPICTGCTSGPCDCDFPVAQDWQAKFGAALPKAITVLFRSTANYSETGGASAGVREVYVELEDVELRSPDGVGDVCDNADGTYNPYQLDTDGDGVGDVADDDADGDGHADASDNCPFASNADQSDADTDGTGDVCDNCPSASNAGQEDQDGDGVGDACDDCPFVPDAAQLDADGDGAGDVCDNCPATANPNQTDSDSGTVLSEDFSEQSFDGWRFTWSENGDRAGVNAAGYWHTNIVEEPTAGNFVARLVAESDLSVSPWNVHAAIDRDLHLARQLNVGLCFNALQGTGGNGLSYFSIAVLDALDTTRAISYGLSTTGDVGGDITLTASASTCDFLQLDLAQDFASKYGDSIPDHLILRFMSYADYAEGAPSDRARTTDVSVDFFDVIGPDGIGDACDVCPDEFDPSQADGDTLLPLDDFEIGPPLIGWSWAASTNGQREGSLAVGSWSSSVTWPALSGSYSARVYAQATSSTPPWLVDAAIARRVDGSPTHLAVTLNFDAIQGTDGVGLSVFYIIVRDAGDAARTFVYGFNTPGDRGDLPFAVTPGQTLSFSQDIAADFVGKHGTPAPTGVDIQFRSSADYAESAASGQRVRSADVRIDDIVVTATIPDGVGDACDNCASMNNTPQFDFDADGQGDACDTDDDGDLVDDMVDNCPRVDNAGQSDSDLDSFGDACDCAPADALVHLAPIEIGGLMFSTKTDFEWVAEGASSTNYDVMRGSISELPVGSGASESCLAASVGGTAWSDATPPSAGTGNFYLVRGINQCDGTWGYYASPQERVTSICP